MISLIAIIFCFCGSVLSQVVIQEGTCLYGKVVTDPAKNRQICKCDEGYEGDYCHKRIPCINGHYNFSKCVCDKNYEGKNCDKPKCFQGFIINTSCFCNIGWDGTFCDRCRGPVWVYRNGDCRTTMEIATEKWKKRQEESKKNQREYEQRQREREKNSKNEKKTSDRGTSYSKIGWIAAAVVVGTIIGLCCCFACAKGNKHHGASYTAEEGAAGPTITVNPLALPTAPPGGSVRTEDESLLPPPSYDCVVGGNAPPPYMDEKKPAII